MMRTRTVVFFCVCLVFSASTFLMLVGLGTWQIFNEHFWWTSTAAGIGCWSLTLPLHWTYIGDKADRRGMLMAGFACVVMGFSPFLRFLNATLDVGPEQTVMASVVGQRIYKDYERTACHLQLGPTSHTAAEEVQVPCAAYERVTDQVEITIKPGAFGLWWLVRLEVDRDKWTRL